MSSEQEAVGRWMLNLIELVERGIADRRVMLDDLNAAQAGQLSPQRHQLINETIPPHLDKMERELTKLKVMVAVASVDAAP